MAGRFKLSKSAVDRHRAHIREVIARADQDQGRLTIAMLIDKLGELEEEAARLTKRARLDRDKIAALVARLRIVDGLARLLQAHELEQRIGALEAVIGTKSEHIIQ